MNFLEGEIIVIKIKPKTWQKIGELILDYTKIMFAIGVLSPFVNGLNLDNCTMSAIIVMVIVMITTGLITYNKGVDNE